jgi:hypothetical protein
MAATGCRGDRARADPPNISGAGCEVRKVVGSEQAARKRRCLRRRAGDRRNGRGCKRSARLRRRGRDVYDTGTFRPLLREDPVPVVVDHGEREIGHVREFAYREAPEGGTWCFAHCRLDEQPGWLGPGTPCSFGSALRRSIDLGGIERVVDQRILEITVCSSSQSPIEPLARVEWIGDPSPDLPAVAATTYARAAGELPFVPRVSRRNTDQVLAVGGVPIRR